MWPIHLSCCVTRYVWLNLSIIFETLIFYGLNRKDIYSRFSLYLKTTSALVLFENQACVELGDVWYNLCVITTLWISCPFRQSPLKYSSIIFDLLIDGNGPSSTTYGGSNAPDIDGWPILTIKFSFPFIRVQKIRIILKYLKLEFSIIISKSLPNA